MVEATLPKDEIKEDKIAYRTQEMFVDTLQPLVACLELAGEDSFTIKEAIPLVQSAIILIGLRKYNPGDD